MRGHSSIEDLLMAEHLQRTLDRPARISYVFMALLLVSVVWLHLGGPLLAALFSYLALTKLALTRRGGKWMAVGIFVVLISVAAYGLGYFVKHAVKSLPEIADRSIPSVLTWAKQRGIELPFSDYDSLKDLAIDTVKGEASYLSGFAKAARGATTNLLFVIAGCVVAVSIFLNPRFELGRDGEGTRNNLYSRSCAEIQTRFARLYEGFLTVMGAQIIISAINTVLTASFVLALGLPYAVVIVGVTFICGLLPVVGNLISNTVVVMIGFTISPKMALGALIFLVAVHKLEYFLNSKIVGWRIRNPLWLTLIGLVVGERLMGVAGMILAPVVLNYIKVEASRFAPDSRRADDSETPNPLAELHEETKRG